MKCEPIKQNLFNYAEGNLSEVEKLMVTEHLKSCSDCRKLANILIDSFELIESQKVLNPNPFIYTRIEQKLQTQKLTKSYSGILKPILVSLMILISLYGGIRIGKIYIDTATTNQYSSNSENYYWNDITQESLEISLLDGNQKSN